MKTGLAKPVEKKTTSNFSVRWFSGLLGQLLLYCSLNHLLVLTKRF